MTFTMTDKIAARAAELWVRMLTSPKYDALGDTGSPADRQTMAAASLMALQMPNNADEDTLSKFGEELKKSLMDEGITHHQRCYLNVDYGPCEILSNAAERAGLKMEFPWKTNMQIYSDRISVSYGYRADAISHHLMPDGRWLVAKLTGPDISIVMDYVNGGSPSFTVEE